jgi:hypothetical protein
VGVGQEMPISFSLVTWHEEFLNNDQ